MATILEKRNAIEMIQAKNKQINIQINGFIKNFMNKKSK